MPAPKGFGRPTIHTLGEILNALFSTVSKEWLPVVVASACSRVPYGEMAHRLSLRQRLGTEKALGWSVENWSKHSSAQRRPRRSALMRWAEGLAKEGKMVEVGTSICQPEDFTSCRTAGWWNAPLPADWPQQEDGPSD
jgi:hypothetical protein